MPVAIAQEWEFGATTVSASLALAAASGIAVFATGGIGGVHRGAGATGDVSADLDALAHHPVVTVSAGAKAFLDLPRTLEYLETVGVPVLGWRHDDFPAFYTRSSGLPVPHRVETAAEVAAVLEHRTRERSGVLVVVPIPEQDALDQADLDAVIAGALADCDADGVTGAAVTPFVLARIGAATEGRSVPANLALAENNASVAAEIAVAIADLTVARAQPARDPRPSSCSAAERDHVDDLVASDEGGVGDDLQGQPVEHREQPPRGRIGVIRREDRRSRHRPRRSVRTSACHSRLSRRETRCSAGRRAASAQASSHSCMVQSDWAGAYDSMNMSSWATGSVSAAIRWRARARSPPAACSKAAASTSSIDSK